MLIAGTEDSMACGIRPVEPEPGAATVDDHPDELEPHSWPWQCAVCWYDEGLKYPVHLCVLAVSGRTSNDHISATYYPIHF